MKVFVRFMAQLRHAAGVAAEVIELPEPCSPAALVQLLVKRHGEGLRLLLLDASGKLHPTILMFVNDEQGSGSDVALLQDGDEVTFLSPIAGG
jgi:molybdopterin converting factor small subunit